MADFMTERMRARHPYAFALLEAALVPPLVVGGIDGSLEGSEASTAMYMVEAALGDRVTDALRAAKITPLAATAAMRRIERDGADAAVSGRVDAITAAGLGAVVYGVCALVAEADGEVGPEEQATLRILARRLQPLPEETA